MSKCSERASSPNTSLLSRSTIAGGVVLLLLGLLAGIMSASAVHTDGLFELEANAIDDPDGDPDVFDGDDWENLDDGAGDPNTDDSAQASIFITDPVNTQSDDIFLGGNSKDDQDVNQWAHTDQKPQAKNDIMHAYAAAYEDVGGDLILYFGLDRYANNGAAQVGFWFFQNEVVAQPDGTFGPGVHDVNDILIQSEFTNGGAIDRIQAFRWLGDGTGDTADGDIDLVATGIDCDVAVAGDDLCGNVNTGCETVPAGDGWTFTPKFAKNADNSPCAAAGEFPSGSFFEGGINLSAFFPGGLGCLSSFMAETRSSPAEDSTLSDFALGSFDLCDITVTKIAPANVCEGDDNVTYDYGLENTGAVSLTDVTAVDDNATPLNAADDVALALVGLTDEDGDGFDDDLAVGATATASLTVTLGVGTYTNIVTATGNFGTDTVTHTDDATVNVYTCSIDVTKACVDGITITFSGTVTNTGVAALIDVTASDDHAGPLTLVGLTDVDGDTIADDLAPGAAASYSGSYVPTTSPSTNTVTASGDAFAPGGQTDLGFSPEDSASATCEVPPSEGCTPGFWQGGLGVTLWNTVDDPDWDAVINNGTTNPFLTTTLFESFFPDPGNATNGLTMLDIVGTGGGSNPVRKAARDLVAGYLNASTGMDYPFTLPELIAKWNDAIAPGGYSFQDFHLEVAAANELGCPF